MLDQDGLGHHRTRAAWTGEPGYGREEVEEQDNQIAHGTDRKQAGEIDKSWLSS